MKDRRIRPAQPRFSTRSIVLLAASLLLGACGGNSDSITGPQGDSCGPGPYFTALPSAPSDLSYVAIWGGVDAPGHTLPTDHGGLFFNHADVTLYAPGDIAVTQLRRVRFSGPDVPPGDEDYAIFFKVCKEITAWYGHVASLSSRFSPSTVNYTNCRTYSVIWADVETCEASGLDIKVAAGEEVGTSGGVTDVGVWDDRVDNFFVAAWRWAGGEHSVCMWEQWDATNREFLFSKLRDPVRPDVVPSGQPRCGTMEVDVAGTARGVWAELGVTDVIGGADNRYIALVNYPYLPQEELALSLGPESLGAHMAYVPRENSGRVNRAFEQVKPDGLIYCYGPDTGAWKDGSWFLSLTSESELTIEHVSHALGESPCANDPSTWSFSGNAVAMER